MVGAGAEFLVAVGSVVRARGDTGADGDADSDADSDTDSDSDTDTDSGHVGRRYGSEVNHGKCVRGGH